MVVERPAADYRRRSPAVLAGFDQPRLRGRPRTAPRPPRGRSLRLNTRSQSGSSFGGVKLPRCQTQGLARPVPGRQQFVGHTSWLGPSCPSLASARQPRASPRSARGSSRRTRDACRPCRRANHVQRRAPRPSSTRLDVEVVEHLEVVGDEADRRDRRRPRRLAPCELAQVVAARPARATGPAAGRCGSGRRPRSRSTPTASATRRAVSRELLLVAAAAGHRGRDAVRGEDERRAAPALARRDARRGARDAVGVRLDEARVVVERAQLQHLRRARARPPACAR